MITAKLGGNVVRLWTRQTLIQLMMTWVRRERECTNAVRKNPHLRDTNDGMVHKEIQRFLKYVLQKLQKKKAQTAEIPENHEATD